MLPMNGFKGFSLGLAVEVISGALIGAKMGLNAVQGSDGIFFIAIDPEKFVGRDTFEAYIEDFIQEIKRSDHKAEVTELLIPGERSEHKYMENNNKNKIDIVDTVYEELKELAA